MVARAAPTRRIDRVSAAAFALLEHQRFLPKRYGDKIGRKAKRQATRAEIEAVSWLVLWDGSTVAGYAGFVDRYDPHYSEDVREVVCIEGSARAVVELVQFVMSEGRVRDRRTIALVDEDNAAMRAACERLGGAVKRVVYETA